MKQFFIEVAYIFSLFGEFVRDMRAQKKRTTLTIFGIVWGTAAVVIMMALGTSTKRQNITNFNGIGDGIILIWPGTTTKPYEGFGVDRRIWLQESDVELLNSEIPEIKMISGEYQRWDAYVRYGTKVRNPLVTGVPPHYWEIRNVIPRPGGRFINQRDVDEKRRIIFLGDDLKDFLFGEAEDAIGEFVYLNGVPFRVIGVLIDKVQNSSYGMRDTERAFIPITTFKSMFGHRYLSNVIVTPDIAKAPSTFVSDRIYEVMGRKYKFDPADKDALGMWDTAEFFSEFMLFFNAFTVFLVIMGAMTLGVGGLGVSNIMYVVVRERTREIGIKRAVGAKRHVIMAQFFAETFFITLLGAGVGFLIAWGLTSILIILPDSVKNAIGTPAIDPTVAIVSILIIGAIGFVSGFFPARKAARLDPIECLRY
ncbi:MAG: ABC transporter permease [bacterium]|nr:MAG: ABC transporter permease [bacterium]